MAPAARRRRRRPRRGRRPCSDALLAVGAMLAGSEIAVCSVFLFDYWIHLNDESGRESAGAWQAWCRGGAAGVLRPVRAVSTLMGNTGWLTRACRSHMVALFHWHCSISTLGAKVALAGSHARTQISAGMDQVGKESGLQVFCIEKKQGEAWCRRSMFGVWWNCFGAPLLMPVRTSAASQRPGPACQRPHARALAKRAGAPCWRGMGGSAVGPQRA